MTLINAQHLAPALGFFEPQRTFSWVLEIGLDDVGDQILIMQSLESFGAPKESNETIELHHGNEVRKVAGKVSFEDITLVLKDFVDSKTAQAVAKWRRLVYNPETGSVGLARDYKKSADLIMFAPDLSSARVWKLFGVWPKDVDYGTLDMTSSDKVTLSLTLSIDRVMPGFAIAIPAGINQGMSQLPI